MKYVYYVRLALLLNMKFGIFPLYLRPQKAYAICFPLGSAGPNERAGGHSSGFPWGVPPGRPHKWGVELGPQGAVGVAVVKLGVGVDPKWG